MNCWKKEVEELKEKLDAAVKEIERLRTTTAPENPFAVPTKES